MKAEFKTKEAAVEFITNVIDGEIAANQVGDFDGNCKDCKAVFYYVSTPDKLDKVRRVYLNYCGTCGGGDEKNTD